MHSFASALLFLVRNYQIMGDRHFSGAENLQINEKKATVLMWFGHESLCPWESIIFYFAVQKSVIELC